MELEFSVLYFFCFQAYLSVATYLLNSSARNSSFTEKLKWKGMWFFIGLEGIILGTMTKLVGKKVEQ